MIRILLALAILLPSPLRAEDATTIRRFADERFAAGDWFRAATEYLRAASYAPDAPERDEWLFRAARSAYSAGRFAEARRDLIALAAATSATELAERSRFVAAAAAFRLGDHDAARMLAAETRAANPGSPLRDRLAYLEGRSAIRSARWRDAIAAFGAVQDPSPLAGSAADLGRLAERGERMRPRSPWVSGALSAVIPGLGQALHGWPWDGLTAMLLVGGGVALIAAGAERDHAGLLTTGIVVTGAFYPANIRGGANAAGRADRRDLDRIQSTADRLSTLSLE